MCSIKTCEQVYTAAKLLQVINAMTAVVSGFYLYGTIGRADYNTMYHIRTTSAEEREIWLKTLLYLVILIGSTFFSMAFGRFAEWLDDVICERRCRARRQRTELIINAKRASANIAVE